MNRKGGNHELKEIFRDGVLLHQVFAPASYLKPALLLALQELDLSAVTFMNGVDTMLAALDTSALKTLRVTCCPDAYVLFQRMSALPEHQRPRLHELQIYHEQSPGPNPISQTDHSDRTITALNALLLSTPDTLHTLWIIMRGRLPHDRLLDPLAPGITNHGTSLVRLTLDIRRGQPPYDGVQRVGWFRRASLEKLCARMSRLEMLYVPFPPVVANEFLDYGREFRAYVATVLQIPTLKTLNVTTWPYPMHTDLHDRPAMDPRRRDLDTDPPYIEAPFDAPETDDLPVAFYTHCLLYLVTWIAEMRAKLVCAPRRPLEVVGFGMPETGHYLHGLGKYLDPVFFVRVRTETGEEVMRQRSGREVRGMGCAGLVCSAWKIEWMGRRWVAGYEEGFHYE